MHRPAKLLRPLVLAAIAATANAARGATAYVPNEGSATISVIDTATDTVTGSLRHGEKPRGIALSADGTRLYLSDQTGKALIVVDVAGNSVAATIPLGDSPEAIYLSPDGKWLSAAIEDNDEVVLVDTKTLKVDRRIKVPGRNPEHAVFSPNGKWLYVSAENSDAVDIIDLAARGGLQVRNGGQSPARYRLPPGRQPCLCCRRKCGRRRRARSGQPGGRCAHQGGCPLQWRAGAPGRQAGLRHLRRQWNGASDRSDAPTRSCRKLPSAAVHGTWR